MPALSELTLYLTKLSILTATEHAEKSETIHPAQQTATSQ